ncbi:MAG TPA: hypothetical protein VK756_10705 [Solirubrobacteraceae bacterium]|jgi:hypothetical protein|nr:hypothetical protein [Solirubrobacteraceae bacterium]
MKITLPDPTMAQLEILAEQRGEPASRIATQMVCTGLAEGKDPRRDDSSISASSPATVPDRNAPWIEPVLGDSEWRSYMWGSIVALYGRYPHALAPPIWPHPRHRPTAGIPDEHGRSGPFRRKRRVA